MGVLAVHICDEGQDRRVDIVLGTRGLEVLVVFFLARLVHAIVVFAERDMRELVDIEERSVQAV